MAAQRLQIAERDTRSVRFSFEFDRDGIRLFGRCRRSKLPPRGLDPAVEPPPQAVTIELRGADGRVLHRQVLTDPIPQTVELIGPGNALSRVAAPPTRGTFTAVVPNLEAARTVVVTAGPLTRLAQPVIASLPPGEGRRRVLAQVPFEGR